MQKLTLSDYQEFKDYEELPAANGPFKPSATQQRIMDMLSRVDQPLSLLYKNLGTGYLRALQCLQKQGIVEVYIHIVRKKSTPS